jgi:hypothetical protein
MLNICGVYAQPRVWPCGCEVWYMGETIARVGYAQ